ncbi:outer membrane protein assembly factor BamE [Sansalvadorimonas sp. 2012CJ34-2]|uniref:Outer membrane protein assembly factor BamE n=1 Tax=Parendozoicomonas callyspongiae TaxID=2942213 RepID=A0ABT0PF45_9GAMM|nr:outer membrane protein assembly factor BamE [Sansalvadorimonas sp. 2012CJ34-2]MCL6270004.1 outer membrane protein assembly factor BamE [Sansalvadorimonas sp. 2012CJ34-2]
MQKRKATFALVLAAGLIGGCSWFSSNELKLVSFPGAYKIDIQQGNVITQDMVNQLKPGMTREQVLFVMGEPLLPDTYDKKRWDYIYSFQPGGGARTQQTLSLFFNQGKLTHFEGDVIPGQSSDTIDQQVRESASKDAAEAKDQAVKEQKDQ